MAKSQLTSALYVNVGHAARSRRCMRLYVCECVCVGACAQWRNCLSWAAVITAASTTNNNNGKSLMSSSFINEKTGVLATQIGKFPIRRKRHATRHRRRSLGPCAEPSMKPSAALANGAGGPGVGVDGDEDDEQKNCDHFEGDPRPLPYAFEKELIDNANRHIRICEAFGPSNRGRFARIHMPSHSNSFAPIISFTISSFLACFQFIPSLPSSMPKPKNMRLRRRSATGTTTASCPRITRCWSRRCTAGYRCSVARLLAI